TAKILTDQTKNHELDSREENNTREHCRNAQCQVPGDPNPVYQNQNERQDAQTGYKQTHVNGKSQRFDGKIQKHIQPQLHQLSKCITRRCGSIGAMFHLHLLDVSGCPIDQTVDVRIRAAILDDFVNQESVHDLEAREIKVFWFVQHECRNPVVEPAPSVAKP